jgi:hypothetical protein
VNAVSLVSAALGGTALGTFAMVTADVFTDPALLGMSLPGLIGSAIGSGVGSYVAARRASKERFQTEARTIAREESQDETRAHVRRFHAPAEVAQ